MFLKGILLIIVVSILAIKLNAKELDAVCIYKKCASAVVQIQLPDGSASGFIISKDGWIVTNKHVVQDSSGKTYRPQDILIITKDSCKFHPVIVDDAEDFTKLDISLLKIDTNNLPYLKLLPSGDADIGENIVTIGHPEDLFWTITKGIVSNYYKANYIQMALATNSGNSGGPVINANGYVVGVHTMGFKAMQLTNFATKISGVRKILKKRGILKKLLGSN
jgi:S1-C subfamily serine protease